MAATSARRASPTARTASSPRCAATARRPCRMRWWRRRKPPWPRMPLRSRARVRQLGDDVAGSARLDVAANLAAQLDLDLAVADRPRHLAAGADQQPFADHQIAFENAAYIGVVDLGATLEEAGLGDVDIAAILQIGPVAALNDQRVT